MKRTERDEEREEHINMGVIVDAYTHDEQAMGWHIYLEETMDVPFQARCTDELEVSPLTEGETVRVVGTPSAEPSLRQQFVTNRVEQPRTRCPTTSTRANYCQ